MTAPNDPPTLGGVPFPPCVEVTTDRRTAPIIGIPFDLKPCPIEELSPEMIEAAKAAEREAHPLRVIRYESTLTPKEREEILAYLGDRERVLLLPPSAVIEYIEAADYGPLVASAPFVKACIRTLHDWERTLRPGRKRPGQWGERARAKRHARRLAADDRKVAEWQRRQGYNRPLNRRQLRALGIYEPMPRGR